MNRSRSEYLPSSTIFFIIALMFLSQCRSFDAPPDWGFFAAATLFLLTAAYCFWLWLKKPA